MYSWSFLPSSYIVLCDVHCILCKQSDAIVHDQIQDIPIQQFYKPVQTLMLYECSTFRKLSI